MEDKDDHVYYNVLFNNVTNLPQQAVFSETRTANLIENPQDFHMCFVRFSIPTQLIPLFLWPTINNDGVTVNNNYYSFTYSYGSTIYRSYLTYLQWTSNVMPAVYVYQNFIDCMNIALYNGFIYMQANAAGFPGLVPPYFIYDASTQVFSLVADTTFFCNSTTSTGIKLYSNYILHTFFESIPHIEISFNSSQGTDELFVIENIGNNTVTTNYPSWLGVYTAESGYRMDAQYPILQNWSSLKSIIFTSSELRTKTEYIQSISTLNQNANLNIITDYEPSRSELGYQRSWAQFFPKIYRYADMTSNVPLQSVSIQVYWSDILNNLYPIYIPPGLYFSIKILFKKKYLVY